MNRKEFLKINRENEQLFIFHLVYFKKIDIFSNNWGRYITFNDMIGFYSSKECDWVLYRCSSVGLWNTFDLPLEEFMVNNIGT